MVKLPRLLIAAPASGHGKTTITTGIMAALRARGLTVSPHKVGPDYIDPGFHALACGRPGRNLDVRLTSEELLLPLLLHGAQTPTMADVALIEGVMGLFDGQLQGRGFASSAHVAVSTSTPVVLCVDTSKTSRSIGALVHGFATWDPRVQVAGVILNKVASPRHEAEVRAALAEGPLPVLGSVPRDASIEAPERHLGLVPVEERAESVAVIAALADKITRYVDVDALLELAHTALDVDAEPWNPADAVTPVEGRPVIAMAGGRAFTFRYPETAELLTAAGADVVTVDPLHDDRLPDGVAGLYLGGGFPEVHADQLTANVALRADIARHVRAGLPTVAECAGLLYLGASVDGVPMTGALETTSAMHPRLLMGYRHATAPADTLLARAGETCVGHEFHRTRVTGADAQDPAWAWDDVVDGVSVDPADSGQPTVHASYLHLHWAGNPQFAQRFTQAAANFGGVANSATPWTEASTPTADPVVTTPLTADLTPAHRPSGTPEPEPTDPLVEPDLWHHGDRDIVEGGVDFAVNVHPAGPPAWLQQALADVDLSVYPQADVAREALARHHRLPLEQVLPTAGGAEAFSLIARGLTGRRFCVVHPQFTEPEAALRTAGAPVTRHLLTTDTGFRLDVPRLIAQLQRVQADVVMLGNPTNPTGVLHPAADLLTLRDAGYTVIVDEAFIDAVPGQEHSLLHEDLTGILVIRSLTKMWSIPGVRAGWIAGDADLVAQLAPHQPPWSLSAAAIAALVATSTPEADVDAASRARAWEENRQDLLDKLRAAGGEPVPGSRAPFVLVDTGTKRSVREPLSACGIGVRRGESFPGLGERWIRVALRTPELHTMLCDALRRLREGGA